jgi:hypothetical protein
VQVFGPVIEITGLRLKPQAGLPRHRNATGVLRVDQVIHALGGVGNRELYA